VDALFPRNAFPATAVVLSPVYTAGLSLKKKISGRESQGACLQDELIGVKPPVVK
jgi:hypothetical protein